MVELGELDEALRRALSALNAGNAALALSPLLDAWRERPTEALDSLVADVSALAARGRSLDGGKGLHAAWLALERQGDPADMPLLLERMPGPGAEMMRARVSAIVARPADPRIESWMVAWLCEPTLTGTGGRTVAFDLLDALARARSPATMHRLAQLSPETMQSLRRTGAMTVERFAAVAAQVAASRPSPALTQEQAELVRALSAAAAALRPPSTATAESLLSAVAAEPQTDSARWVYSDWLLERGDERGEFIALQLHRAAHGGAPSQRERELSRRFSDHWLAPLMPVLVKKHVAFERGFLSSCGVKPVTDAHRALIGHPMFATVTRIDLTNADAEWVNHPICRAVDTVTGVNLSALHRVTRQLRHLGLQGFSIDSLAPISLQTKLETLTIVNLPAHADWLFSQLKPALAASVREVILDDKKFAVGAS